jgi:NAD(P)-dependent dehydrogenase (short-subunit alcohol dehydrogenase family)
MRDLADGVAVVTGGGSGIGQALAERFAAEGMRVVVADVDLAGLSAVARGIADAYGADRVLAVPTDVRDPDAVDALAAATVEHFGAVHVLCNNAGVGSGGAAWEVTPERWRWVVDVNLLGVAYGLGAFVPHLLAQDRGHVVNTASAAGLLTGPGMAPYFATKHAVVAMSESLHLDLRNAHSSVGVSVLCPEWVRGTRIHDAERNLPVGDRAGGDGSPLVDGILRSLVNGGTDPAELAGEVVAAIREDRFWVLPHRESTLESARLRWAAIDDGRPPPAWDFGVRARASAGADGVRRGRRRRDDADASPDRHGLQPRHHSP